MKIETGNLNHQKDSEKRGWFIGHFMQEDSPFQSHNFEVRWAVHSKGEVKPTVAANKIAKTISVLIKGKMILKFPKDDEEIVLSKEGDYAFWDSNIYHTSEILEDSTVLTIRWPSISGDQKSL
ncbi:signal peptidase I [Candidatus Pacearchaeota archaeon]|nr:signal peptidase I [Candidatus Pacearchaeota archaeon]|tara:strand:- start:3642 stop:4010 length:369 start_codon:yes stop_codon:yes gene_type:complete